MRPQKKRGLCTVEGCDRFEPLVRGLCAKHYHRVIKTRPPKLIESHGMRGTAEYQAWQNIKVRCYDKKQKFWPLYGGRGIQVCDRWLKFSNFYADMGPRPSPNHSLDRIDNNGNYCPENCRWATQAQQMANTRRTVFMEHKGIKLHMAGWAQELGISKSRFRYLARVKNMSLEAIDNLLTAERQGLRTLIN